MHNSYDLNNILEAIESINQGQIKKNNFIESNKSKDIKEEKEIITVSDGILPSTEKIILEAELYSSKIKKNSSMQTTLPEDVLILNDEYNEKNLDTIDLKKIKLNIIDDLYSSLSKKVKKKTLKTIFDLHKNISELKNQIEVLKINKTSENITQVSSEKNLKINDDDLKKNKEHLINEEPLINKENLEQEKEHLINEEPLINKENLEQEKEHLINEDSEYLLTGQNNNNLSTEVIETLKLQNLIIKRHEKNEEKLRFQIIDLEQDITILSKK